jgi:hypothetical protein
LSAKRCGQAHEQDHHLEGLLHAIQCKDDLVFLIEVANTACYLIINGPPSIVLNKKTPTEVWSGTPTDYSQWKVSGCTTYDHIDNGKLEPRAI